MNVKIFRYLLALMLCAAFQARGLEVRNLTCEMAVDPLAISTSSPRFGWQIHGTQNTMQTAYQLEVYTTSGEQKHTVWNSGRVTSAKSQMVTYRGSVLSPLAPYYWRVKVWDTSGTQSPWSKSAQFRVAPDKDFLSGDWIGAVDYDQANFPEGRNYSYQSWRDSIGKARWAAVDTLAYRSIMLRKDFSLNREIADATVYVCGLGHYELSINGGKVGDGEFTPLWSDYDHTVYYNTYDVTDYVHDGENAIGVLLGNGFYNVVKGNRYSKLQVGFGPETLWLKMLVSYTDGTQQVVATDGTWKYDLSPITFHSMYGGEDYDARLEQTGWDMPGFKASGWRDVVVQHAPKGKLEPQLAPPVKIMERFGVKKIHKLTPEEVAKASVSTKREVDASAILLDMGQNLAGFPEITVTGRAGQKITMVVGEGLTPENAPDQKQTGRQHIYTYTLKGGMNKLSGGEYRETWHPRFSYYGFRYILLEGAVLAGQPNPDGLPVVDNIESCFVYNSAPEISEFECSSDVLTGAHRLIRNAERSNMQAVFTDCPHREKLGWLEQVHLNGPSLFYNYDVATLMPKVMRDISDSQRADGMVPTTAPQYIVFEGKGLEPFAESPEWGATLLVTPWQYYEAYGDDRLIREYYPQMKAYVDYLGTRAEDNLIDFGLGDWYDYGDFKAGFSRNTPIGLVASAHYYQDLVLLADAARLIGNEADAAEYSALAAKVCEAFNAKYLDKDKNTYGTGSQTSNSLPLYLGMVPDDRRDAVLFSLVDDIHAHGDRLTTGDVGNRYLFRTLSDNGLDSLMVKINDHYDAPGYGFQQKFGATTLTEQWDPRQGSSWNHFMMGQLDEWLFRSLLGIRHHPSYPGMQNFIIQPSFDCGITSARGRTATLYGDIYVDWQLQPDNTVILTVEVPGNTMARVYLPGEPAPRLIGSGRHVLTTSKQNQ